MEHAALLCGFGKREITPPIGSPIVGYYKKRFVKGVIDPLFVRAAMFQSGETRALIIALDVCLIQKVWSDRIREKCAQAFNMDIDAIILNASHTHTGPLTGNDFASELVVDPGYLDMLVEQAYCAAGEALVDLKPARLFYAETEAKGIAFLRRYRMKDGTVKTNPKNREEIECPMGKPDETVRLLKIRREGADDVCMVHFGTHADTVHGEYISADWPGYVCSILEAAIPGSKAMFLLGPQGDAAHANRMVEDLGIVVSEKRDEDVKETAADARYMGRVIVGSLLQVFDRAEEIGNEGISFAKTEMQLPTNRINEGIEEAERINAIYLAGRAKEEGIKQGEVVKARRLIRLQNAPPFYVHTAYALRIGGFVFSGVPGEPFTEIGRRIYAASPFPRMMVCCQTNVSCGYVPDGAAYEEGGYEANTSSFKKGADDAYVQAAVQALKMLEKE